MSERSSPFNGDRPIADGGEDRLGFAPAAQHVARAINDLASPDGFVIGIEGEWGSGKSSFINLVTDALRGQEIPPEVVRFLPWLISSRHALLKELFSEIAKAALRIDLLEAPDQTPETSWTRLTKKLRGARHSEREARRKDLELLFEKFSSRLAAVGKLADVASALGVPLAGSVSSGVGAGTEAAAKLLAEKPLKEEKEQLQDELQRLSRKVIVFIDDLDRLEPSEACEVLRLVRAVADFPNIVYVLCYSRQIVARNLSAALGIEDGKGEEFIEKIVQATFTIPQPEAFDLRRMFRKELQHLYPELLSNKDPSKRLLQDRLSAAVDIEGGRTLRTPRHVVRAINSLRFYATPVLDLIDLPDMVWLQLIRVRSLSLYQWIEGYMTGVAAISNGASISGTGKGAQAKALKAIFEESDRDDGTKLDDRWQSLSECLPGLKHHLGNALERSWRLHEETSEDELAELISHRRLGSPQHYRYYFALSPPNGAISDVDFRSFVQRAAEAPDEAVEQFRLLATTTRPQGGVMAEALLDRLQGRGLDQIPATSLPGVLLAVADGIDDAAVTTGRGDWDRYWIWNDASRLFKGALTRLKGAERDAIVRNVFGSGRSLGWLTNVFRSETFAHGLYGDRRESEKDWILTSDEFQTVTGLLLRRYEALSTTDVRHVPGISAAFYAWVQVAPDAREAIRAKFADLSRDNHDFLDLLNVMRSWRTVNGELSHPLRKPDLEWLVDFEEVEQRLNQLAQSSPDDSLRRRAAELISAIMRNREDD
ncbi:MAG TPA: P-loop NTPase fold protein [Vicinamibacterales bacterium]|nr:P-loop NTPase fold protein [Vicinamibacterales bacterium]